MKYKRLILVLMLIALIPCVAYSVNVSTGLELHGVIQKLMPATGDDSLTVRDDSLWIVLNDSTRISFVVGYAPGSARLQGGVNKVIEFAFDTVFVDVDSSSANPMILFGNFGGGVRWDRSTDKVQFNNDLTGGWSDIGTSSGLAAADFNDSLESQIEFSPKTHAKLDSSTAVRGAINDSLQTNWATFTAGGSSIKWRDSSYLYLDTANVLGGNTEIKAWLDTTTVRVPIADSTHGGATNATTSKTADSANGGAIRSETTKLADSTTGGAARAESAQGLVAKGVNSGDPADGEYLKYYVTGDTLGWDTPSGSGDVTDVVGGNGLVDNGNTGAITVDLQIGSWPLDLNADSVWLDSTEIVTWALWTEAYDSIDNWNNLINADMMYNDGDTTTGTYVFSSAFRGASAVAESCYATLETIEDSLTLCGRVAGQVWTGTHDFGGGVFEITNAANPTTDAEGEMAWDANDDAIEVYSGDESESVLIPMYQKIDACIFAPDGVADVITLLKVDAMLYPHGIEIDQISFTLPADAAYGIGFHEWTGADPPVFSAQIDTLSTTASDAYVEDGSPADGAIAADATVRANILSTDVDWVHIQIIFHVTEGN